MLDGSADESDGDSDGSQREKDLLALETAVVNWSHQVTNV